MFTPQVVDLAYIGHRATKTDNVCGTGTVWIGFGDIQKVERKYIPVFLKHPDVWMLADKFRELHGQTEPLTGDQTGGELHTGAALIPGSTVAASVDVTTIVPVQLPGDETITDSAPAVVNIQAGLADIVPPAGEPESGQGADPSTVKPENGPQGNSGDDNSEKTGEQLAVIKNAILSLEQGNPKHFSTTNGVPIVSAVRNAAADETITAADVRKAWAELSGKAE